MTSLQGKVAVITGGNSGIGLAAARAFVRAGARVAIFGRNAKTVDAAVNELGPTSALGVVGDVTSAADVGRLVGATVQRFGRIDALFANAGIAEFRPVEAADVEHIDRVFDTNVKGTLLTVQAALPHLNEGASIVLTTSIANERGFPATSVYAASKAAVRSLARTLSRELLPRGVRVNAVSPGPVDTPIFERLGLPASDVSGVKEGFKSQIPLGRMGTPEELAEAVLFLASPTSAFIVGVELVADGGTSQL